MKRDYLKPAMRVVSLRQSGFICGGSSQTAGKVSSNVDFNENITGGQGTARGRQFDVWGEEEEE
jgi:hypothetical protein